MSVRLYTFGEAADELRVKEKWLRSNSTRLPRQKFGRTVRFSDEDLDAIREMHHIDPRSDGASTARISPAGASTVTELKPLAPRSRKTA